MAAVLGVLVIAYLLVNDPFRLFQKGLGSNQVLFPGLKPDQVTKITLVRKGVGILLQKESGVWKIADSATADSQTDALFPNVSAVKDEFWYDANQQLVDKLISTVVELRESKVVSTLKSKWDIFKVGKNFESSLQLFTGSSEPAAAFVIGKNGADQMSQFFRVKNSEKVLQSTRPLSYVLRDNVSAWRDHTIFTLTSTQIQQFTWEYQGKKMQLVRETSGKAEDPKKQPVSQWYGAAGAGAREKLAENRVNQVLRLFASLRAIDFPDKTNIMKLQKEKKRALAKISVKTESNALYELLVFESVMRNNVDKKGKPEIQGFIVQREGSPTFYLISASNFKSLTPSLKDVAPEPVKMKEK